MKPFIFFVLFLSACIYPINTDAARQTSPSSAEHLKRIELLQTQVLKLQKQLNLLLKQKPRTETPEFSYKTKFYTGTYESLYYVEEGRLISSYNTDVSTGDQLLWDTFTQIAGSAFIDTYISEFRIYNDTQSEVSAFVEEKPDNTWILGFNREGEELSEIYTKSSIHDLLLHEYAHIVFFNTDDIEEDYTQRFWSKKSQSYTSNAFVTPYATTNAIEDMVESFVFFVQEDIPTAQGTVYDKMRFFTEYPKMIKLREKLRAGNYF